MSHERIKMSMLRWWIWTLRLSCSFFSTPPHFFHHTELSNHICRNWWLFAVWSQSSFPILYLIICRRKQPMALCSEAVFNKLSESLWKGYKKVITPFKHKKILIWDIISSNKTGRIWNESVRKRPFFQVFIHQNQIRVGEGCCLKILTANISSMAIRINFEMKCLTKAHWCEGPFQAQWLQITLRRLVPAIALWGKWFARCQDQQKGEKAHFALLVSLPLSVYIVQYKLTDIHICLYASVMYSFHETTW